MDFVLTAIKTEKNHIKTVQLIADQIKVISNAFTCI